MNNVVQEIMKKDVLIKWENIPKEANYFTLTKYIFKCVKNSNNLIFSKPKDKINGKLTRIKNPRVINKTTYEECYNKLTKFPIGPREIRELKINDESDRNPAYIWAVITNNLWKK